MNVALRAGAAYFAIAFGAGFALGMVRVPFLVPRLGERWAELLEMPLMLAVIVLAARWVVRRFSLAPRLVARLATGGCALALLVAAEVAMVLVQGLSLPAYVAGRDPVSGSVYLAMVALFGAMPALVGRPAPR